MRAPCQAFRRRNLLPRHRTLDRQTAQARSGSSKKKRKAKEEAKVDPALVGSNMYCLAEVSCSSS